MYVKNGKKESSGKYLVLLKGEDNNIYIVSRRDSIFRENLLSVFSGEKHYNYFIGTILDMLDRSILKFSPAINYIEMNPVFVSISDFNKKLISTAIVKVPLELFAAICSRGSKLSTLLLTFAD